MSGYSIENKIVIAISSSALFNLSESDTVFRNQGEKAYREFQRKNQDITLEKGVAFPFIKRFLRLNSAYPAESPVEVILLSRNDPDTGLRIFNSIKEYQLPITRACFLNGKAPYTYLPAFNACLFLSANPQDVKEAINAGYPAGTVLSSAVNDDNDEDRELRVAFDFDGVIVDDQAETVYKTTKKLEEFQKSEVKKASIPHNPGPLMPLFQKLSHFQRLEHEKNIKDPSYQRCLRTAIITARSAPAHERFVTTLRKWGVTADETFFLGGINKTRVLDILKPHIFFDDQLSHLNSSAKTIPSVHIPFGIANIPPNDQSTN